MNMRSTGKMLVKKAKAPRLKTPKNYNAKTRKGKTKKYIGACPK